MNFKATTPVSGVSNANQQNDFVLRPLHFLGRWESGNLDYVLIRQ